MSNTWAGLLCILLGAAITPGTRGTLCNGQRQKGPYVLEMKSGDPRAPSKKMTTITRARVEQDPELTIAHRSYWSSYCYNGGSMDGNTGCFHGVTQQLPDREEVQKWIEKDKCKVFKGCKDCWGSDSYLCSNPKLSTEIWVQNKELYKSESNKHFAFHTCNLSWRCGQYTSKFPSFLKREKNEWVTYTTYANGTILNLKDKDFWVLDDAVIYKKSKAKIVQDKVELPCFATREEPLSCYDSDWGNFVEFRHDWVCLGKACYLNPLEEKQDIQDGMEQANLKAASIEDLKAVIQSEHFINEELRYNFGLLLKEVQELRNVLTKTIISTAKIDDKLIGNIIGQSARSKFVTENTFFLEPCIQPKSDSSNCAGDFIFKDGRWTEKEEIVECIKTKNAGTLSLFKEEELWLPDLGENKFVGTASDFGGWSYFAKEKENFNRAMRWTENAKTTTSIGDLYNYPKDFFNYSIVGFVTTHLGMVLVLAAIIVFLCKRRKGQAAVALNQHIELEPFVRQHERAVPTGTSSSSDPVMSPVREPTTRGREQQKQTRRSGRGLWDRRDLEG